MILFVRAPGRAARSGAFAIERLVAAPGIARPHALALAVPLVLAIPLAPGVLQPRGILPDPPVGAVLMSASTMIEAINT